MTANVRWWHSMLICLALVTSIAFSFSVEQEEQGKQFYALIRAHLPLIDDPVAVTYINDLGRRLVSFSDDKNERFHFFIVKSPDINAFAGPGGYIGINAGLLTQTRNESELASVMAHEIAHVVQRHIIRGNDRMKQLTWPAIAAVVAGIATGNPAIATGSIAGVSAGGTQYNINVIRSYEKEADAVGIQLLAKAGFDPNAMAHFFERLKEQSRYDTQAFPILRTHPVNEERMAEAENRAKQFPTKTYHSSMQYHLVKARLIVDMSANTDKLLTYAKGLLDKHPDHEYTQYLYALALNNANQDDQAIAHLHTLEQKAPNQLLYPMTLAEIYLKEKNPSQAVSLIEQYFPYNSDYAPLVILYTRALVKDKQAASAVNLLSNYQVDYVDSIPYWLAYSKAEAENGNLVYAHIYRAKAYALAGDNANARIQYQIALKQPGNTDYSKAIIQSALKQLKPNKPD